jgi:flagellar motility protein MotE (MotC chaperone)
MTALELIGRSALRCALTGIAVCGAMLGVLALQGRLDFLREQLLGAPESVGNAAAPPRGAAVALPHLAASTAFFTVPAPGDPATLAGLERELVALQERQREQRHELETRARALDEREQLCTASEARLASAEEELSRLAERLELRAAEVERELALYEAAAEPAERRAARTLAEMEPAAAAALLASTSEPAEAARVFAHLPVDQQASIAAAFDAEQRARFWPAWLRVERARAASAGRKAR